MSFILECIEEGKSPRVVAVELTGDLRFWVGEAPGGKEPGRTTTLHAGPPRAGVVPVLTGMLEQAADGEFWIWQDGSRNMVPYEPKIPGSSARIEFRAYYRGANFAEGSAVQRPLLPDPVGELLWALPTAGQVLTSPFARVRQEVQARAKRLGVSPAIVGVALGGLVALVALLGVAWQEHGRAEQLASTNEGLEAQVANLAADRDASVEAERACLHERVELADKLDEMDAGFRARAEEALALGLARARPAAIGSAEKMEHAAEVSVVQDVADRLRSGELDWNVVKECWEFAERTGDLPPWLALWHPDPARVCDIGPPLASGGVDVLGRWGVSCRTVQALGLDNGSCGALEGKQGADLRLLDRTSFAVLEAGFREVGASLSRPIEGHPAVLRGQRDLWTLAILDLYNGMHGSKGIGLADCVTGYVRQMRARKDSLIPGEPILPDLVSVADGSAKGGVDTSKGATCAWGDAAAQTAAENVLVAVTRLAVAKPLAAANDDRAP